MEIKQTNMDFSQSKKGKALENSESINRQQKIYAQGLIY